MRRVATNTAPVAPPGETRALVKKMALGGMTSRQIARVLDVSTQTVNYHIKSLRREGLLPPDAA